MNTRSNGRHDFGPCASAAVEALTLDGGASTATPRVETARARRRGPATPPDVADLVRYATLASSGHNTQPWRFHAASDEILIMPDLARRTPVVDPDDHHLYASLGCAAENLALAARAAGRGGEVHWRAGGDGALRVGLAPAPLERSALFDAIPARQVSRATYDARPVATDALERLRRAGSVLGVDVLVVDDAPGLEAVLALVVEGNDRQVRDPAFVAELRHWLRFNARSAAASGDGLYAPCAGSPTLPDWIAPTVFKLAFRPGRENDKVAARIRSSAGIAVFVAASDDPKGWANVGRAYERFALQATVEGLRHAFVNQATEVAETRRELRALLGIGERRPSLLVRFGHGPAMPRSLRRPVASVLV